MAFSRGLKPSLGSDYDAARNHFSAVLDLRRKGADLYMARRFSFAVEGEHGSGANDKRSLERARGLSTHHAHFE